MHSDALILFLSKSWTKETSIDYSVRYTSLLELACQMQNGIAYYLLGLEYLNKDSLEENSLKAVDLFSLSAKTGFYKGMYVYGLHLIETARQCALQKQEGLCLIQKAADCGYDLAQDWIAQHNESIE